MHVVSNPPITHVLVRTAFDQEKKRYYWIREIWFNDPVIGAQPPDEVEVGKRRYATQRIAMRNGLLLASRIPLP